MWLLFRVSCKIVPNVDAILLLCTTLAYKPCTWRVTRNASSQIVCVVNEIQSPDFHAEYRHNVRLQLTCIKYAVIYSIRALFYQFAIARWSQCGIIYFICCQVFLRNKRYEDMERIHMVKLPHQTLYFIIGLPTKVWALNFITDINNNNNNNTTSGVWRVHVKTVYLLLLCFLLK